MSSHIPGTGIVSQAESSKSAAKKVLERSGMVGYHWNFHTPLRESFCPSVSKVAVIGYLLRWMILASCQSGRGCFVSAEDTSANSRAAPAMNSFFICYSVIKLSQCLTTAANPGAHPKARYCSIRPHCQAPAPSYPHAAQTGPLQNLLTENSLQMKQAS